MKVALVTLCKKEELYIVEYIEHYLKLGVEHIFLGDNNEENYPIKLDEVVKLYIDNGTVTVIPWKDNYKSQIQFNNYIYGIYDYDWYMFFDVDEFLFLYLHNNINDFISDPKFANYNCIRVNWRIYDDNNLVIYDNRPVVERFPHKAKNEIRNTGIKTIIKKVEGMKISVHGPGKSECALRCDVLGLPATLVSPEHECEYEFKKYGRPYLLQCYEVAELRHYYMKTLDEYINYKIFRGDAVYNSREGKRYSYLLENFFFYNKRTSEKEAMINKVKKKYKEYIKDLEKKRTRLLSEKANS